MPCPEKFKTTLNDYKLDDSIINEINEGYEDITSSSPKKIKAAYFKRAADIMDSKLPPELTGEIFEVNACCKSGSREKASKAFAKKYAALSLAEKLEKIKSEPDKVPNMGTPVLNPDGSITLHAVYYRCGDKFECACSNFNKVKRDYPVSRTYCRCCGGHFLFHYEIMLGMKLRIAQVVSSPLDSDGKNPCVFLLTPVK